MKKEQIKYIVETLLGDSLNKITPLLGARYIKISEREDKKIGIRHSRFKFVYDVSDDDKNWIEVIKCYPSEKDIPSSWVLYEDYDEYDGVTYIYERDSFDQVVRDLYDIENIAGFGVKYD